MDKPKHRQDELPADGVTAYRAAAFLQDEIPERAGYWAWFLVNNRRKDRNPPHRIPCGRRHGVVIYAQSALNAFVAFEKHRRLAGMHVTGRAAEMMAAYGIGSPSGGPYGRKLQYRAVAAENASGPYVQLTVEDPLLVFYLPPDLVTEIATRFAALARELTKEGKRHVNKRR